MDQISKVLSLCVSELVSFLFCAYDNKGTVENVEMSVDFQTPMCTLTP